MNRQTMLGAALAANIAAAGCQLAPPHTLPEMPTADIYPAEYSGDAVEGTPARALGWRDFIVDPRLETLIGAALERNRDLEIAIAQIEQARGAFRMQRADRLPTLDVTGDATRSEVVAGGSFGGGFPSETGGVVESRSVAVGLSAFELDFWGRVRNATEAALAEFLATSAAARAVELSLVREVSDAYLGWLEASERIRLAEATVESRREELEIAERRLDAGAVSALEVAQVTTLLTQAETQLAALRLQRAQSENALTLLIGGPLEEAPPPAPLGAQASAEPLAAGLPSELLAARPDIVAAEERLRGARASIGAARAAFFPSIALTASSGYSSSELDGLFSQDGDVWTFGPALRLPIFDSGRRRANVTIAEAREHEAVADYERTIQTAFREVADALAGRRYLAEQVDAQQRATEAQRDLAELARTRYEAGVVSYLEVLDAERNLFDAEQALLQVRRAEAANLVALYVALGGGVVED